MVEAVYDVSSSHYYWMVWQDLQEYFEEAQIHHGTLRRARNSLAESKVSA